jgi:hypothetical protein
MMGLMRNRAVPACGMDNPILALITLAMTLLVGIALGIVLGFSLAQFGYVAVALTLAVLIAGLAALQVALRAADRWP